MNYIQELFTLFRNKTLNSMGVERDIYQLIKDGDISTAISLMQNREEEVDIALGEYKPELHKVMSRPNKFRKGEIRISQRNFQGIGNNLLMKSNFSSF